MQKTPNFVQRVGPLSNLLQATDAASRIFSLKTELFVLEQELRTMRQIKRAIFAGIAFYGLNLLLFLTTYWITAALFDRGWSAWTLALTCFLFFGFITVVSAFIAIQVGKGKQANETR